MDYRDRNNVITAIKNTVKLLPGFLDKTSDTINVFFS